MKALHSQSTIYVISTFHVGYRRFSIKKMIALNEHQDFFDI